MPRLRLLFLLFGPTLLLLLHTGCATGPVYREYAASAGSPAPGRGRVYIYRPSALPLLDLGSPVHLNDVLLEHWPLPRSFVVIDQPEGEVRVRIYSGEIAFFLKSGDIRYVQIEASMGFGSTSLHLKLVHPDQARSEIEGLRLVGEETGQADPFR
jgi:hypothetical protein